MQVSEIIKITKGKLLSGNKGVDVDLAAISSDSRIIKAGEFFLPLKGANFNGEDFIEDVFKKGAVGVFTEGQGPGVKGQDKIIIQVKDAAEALQKIAHAHRMKFSIPVIGVTGSNGKTTVKDMIAAVLSSRFNVLKSEGTKNNHIGLPQTLLRLTPEHEICVLEMGANHKGEIRLLSDLARPDIAVITNIGPSHLEFLRDPKGVFGAKKEIFEFLNKNGLAIVNGDDEYLSVIKGRKFRTMRFGFEDTNDFRASRVMAEAGTIKFTLNERSSFILNLLGLHNVYNALAAIAVAYRFRISYDESRKALSGYSPAQMRLNINNIDGLVIIDDAYNSNPLSMRYALETVKNYPARARWIVSADMLELGEKEKDFHESIGEAVAEAGFDGLLTFGSLSRHTYSRALECGMNKNRVWHCSSREEVADVLRKAAKQGDVILVKGSRAMMMERVIEKLKGPGSGVKGQD